MKYREDKYGNKISSLGFGCMRFERKGGKIDFEKAEKQIMLAIENGVNYFDTAYIYPGSEAMIGEVFSRNNVRDKVYIASKMPHYLIKSRKDLDRIFSEELSRLKTDRIDYYFMHMLTDVASWERLCELGVKEWIEEKKNSGQIGQIGFSYHGNSDMFIKLVDSFNWEFCMIQYNYMDENSQAGKRGLKYANSKGLPVMIMEPLRGGKLVKNLPPEAKKIFENYKIKRTPAQWAFRWLLSQKEVTCVLSGMNSEQMILDNIKTASETQIGEFTVEDEKMLSSVALEHGISGIDYEGCYYISFRMERGTLEELISDMCRRFDRDNFSSEELVNGKELPIFEKYDRYVPAELLRSAYSNDRIDAKEALKRLKEMNGKHID